jgi:hypothetical protein
MSRTADTDKPYLSDRELAELTARGLAKIERILRAVDKLLRAVAENQLESSRSTVRLTDRLDNYHHRLDDIETRLLALEAADNRGIRTN